MGWRRKGSDDGTAPKHLSELFEVYKKRLRAPQRSVTKEAQKVIEEVTGIKVLETQCRYDPKSRVLTLLLPGVAKQEVLLQAPKVLTVLEKRLGVHSTPHSLL